MILVVLPALAALAGAGFPPIGERKYEIDGRDRSAPAQIKSARSAAKTYMKDPVQPGTLKVPTARPLPKPVAVAKPRAKLGQLRFKPVHVNGHLIRPRVDFERDMLQVERADEPVSQDFFNKVFEPVGRDDF